MRKARTASIYSLVVILSMLLAACSGGVLQPIAPTPSPSPSQAPTQASTATQFIPTPEPTPETLPLAVWIDPRLPEEILHALGDLPSLVQVTSKEEAVLSLTIEAEKPIISWVYALAAPFATVTDDVSLESLFAFWQNNGDFPARVLVMPPAIFDSLKVRYGIPLGDVRPLAENDLLTFCQAHENAWAIVPFETL